MANLLNKRDRLIKDTYNNYGIELELLLISIDELNMKILRLNFKR